MTEPETGRQYPNLTIHEMLGIVRQEINRCAYDMAYDNLAKITPEEVGADIYATHEADIEWLRFVCANKLENIPAAGRHIARAYELKPDCATYAEQYVTILVKQGKPPYQNIIEICDSGLSDPHHDKETKEQKEYLTIWKGLSLYNLGLFHETVQLLESAYTSKPEIQNVKNEFLGYCYFQQGQYAKALAAFTIMQTVASPCLSELAKLCAGALTNGSSPARDYKYATGIDYKEKFGGVEHCIGLLHRVITDKKYNAALDYLDHLISVIKTNDIDYVELLRTKAICHRELGDIEIAEDILGRILPRAFQEPRRYCNVFGTVARQQFQQGDFENGLAHLELAMAGYISQKFKAGALDTMKYTSVLAKEGGYPVLADICGRNADMLRTAASQNAPFPELEGLKLE